MSDTHGWVHPRLAGYLTGVDVILHAGDIGPGVLEVLGSVAPVIAVRGNNDAGPAWDHLPERLEAPCRDGWQVDLHHIASGNGPLASRVLVMTGHSHTPAAAVVGEGVRLNPGAAGKGRFRSVPTAGRAWIQDRVLRWEVRRLDDDALVLEGSAA